MRKSAGLAFVLFFLLSCAFLQADEIDDLKAKIIEIQNKGELGFKDFVLCSQIMGFASYVSLKDSVVDRNGTLLLYYEPANVFTHLRDGMYEIWYTQDMALINEKGEIINEWQDFLNFHYMAKKPVLDLFAQNSLEIKGQLPPGKYQFKAVLKDKLRGNSVTKIIDFELR